MKTWSDVIKIEDSEGRKGGRYWWLTLSCGHGTARRKPRFDPARHILNSTKGLFAPRRVVCLVCKIIEEKQTKGEHCAKKEDVR